MWVSAAAVDEEEDVRRWVSEVKIRMWKRARPMNRSCRRMLVELMGFSSMVDKVAVDVVVGRMGKMGKMVPSWARTPTW